MELSKTQTKIIEYLNSCPNCESERDEIARALDIPRTTIFDNLIKLKKRKMVILYEEQRNVLGRPKVYWKVKH